MTDCDHSDAEVCSRCAGDPRDRIDELEDQADYYRETIEALTTRVLELEALLNPRAGTWTLCTVCGAAHKGGTDAIVHRNSCGLARALERPREESP